MTTPQHEILIVGAGFSGIGVAIALDRAGLSDHVILEEGHGFGGTWYWNRYPGVAVDIPSFSYQFSFEQRSDWSRVYAPGHELLKYAEHCAERYGLHDRVRFGTQVVSAEFDEELHLWRVRTDAGDTLTARHLIDATGALTKPKLPDIPGVDDFAGVTMHTARWDASQEIAGRRVAVVGTGASAVQLIPSIAPEAEHLTVFQRTPIWCMPKPDAPLPRSVRTVLSRVPGVQRLARLASQTFVEVTFPLAAHFHGVVPMARGFERLARRYVRKQVRDPDLAAKLTPRYAMGCKRPSFHNSYLATFNRPNVALETEPIERITARGVVCTDGTEHPADILVLATGFKVFDPGNFPKYPVTGRDGQDLGAWWDANRYQAYEGVTVPKFPNLFMVFAPYGYNGASYFTLIETQARHIVRCLRNARDRGATAVEVTEQANGRFFAEMLRRRKRQVFWQASCSLANSYYFDRHGDAPLRPTPTLEARWRAGRFPLEDYHWQTLPEGERRVSASTT